MFTFIQVLNCHFWYSPALCSFHRPSVDKDDEDDVDTGGAILTFYATLIDLLGRCAPDQQLLSQGRTEPQRIRSILCSLVPLPDLVGVLSLKFVLPSPNKVYEKKEGRWSFSSLRVI